FWVELKRTMATTSKQLVWLFSINGVIWIWCSYILAFMGKEQIAETLSGDVCKVIIGELGLYLVTSTVESVFKYNTFTFMKPKETAKHTSDPAMAGPDEEVAEPA
ncbi:MAG: hypothetical protein K2F99_08915, partial [Muribaculaceae bacterium]|nr:hypothetical protein [Muribaculaceae bacterium]